MASQTSLLLLSWNVKLAKEEETVSKTEGDQNFLLLSLQSS